MNGRGWGGLDPLRRTHHIRLRGCAEAPGCSQPSFYSGRAISVMAPPWVVAGCQPSRAEVAADHRLRLAEKGAVAVGFVAEREADQVVSNPHRDEAPGGEPVRGQAVPDGEHVVEQVREIVVALPLLPLELAAARRGVEDLAESRYAAENLGVRVDRLPDEGACLTGRVGLPERVHQVLEPPCEECLGDAVPVREVAVEAADGNSGAFGDEPGADFLVGTLGEQACCGGQDAVELVAAPGLLRLAPVWHCLPHQI